MATAALLRPHDLLTTINYSTINGDEAPYNYVESPPEGKPRSNLKEDPRDVVVYDMRGKESTVGLDKTGFQFLRHVSEEKEFLDEEAIKSRYYKEVEELLKKETGAKRIFIFDHTIRRNYKTTTPTTRGPVVSDDRFFACSSLTNLHIKTETGPYRSDIRIECFAGAIPLAGRS